MKLRLIFAGLIAVSALITGLMYLLPLPEGTTDSRAFYASLFSMAGVCTLSLSALVLFLLGLRGFQAKAQRAYYILCVGIVVATVSTIALPVASYMDLWSWPLFIYAGLVIPSFLGQFLIYIAVRYFTRTAGLKSWMISTKFIAPIVAVIVLAVAVIPHGELGQWGAATDQKSYVIIHSIRWVQIFFDVVIVALLLFLSSHISPIYKRALIWLAVAAAIDGLSMLQVHGYEHFGPEHAWTTATVYGVSPFAFVPIALMLSAYSFSRLSAYTPKSTAEKITSVDIVVYASRLATRPEELDTSLDVVRSITASKTPDQKLDESAEQKLKQAYLEIETYLTTKEPVLNFTPDALRHRISVTFEGQTDTTFWPKLAAKPAEAGRQA